MTKYLVKNGETKAFDGKEELKKLGAKWDKDIKSWWLDSPTGETKQFIEGMGLKVVASEKV